MKLNLKLNSISDFQIGDRVYSFNNPQEILEIVQIVDNNFVVC